MGLLDVLNGMQNGPHGAGQSTSGGSGGGISPTTIALIGLLAYKAFKSFGGQANPNSQTPTPNAAPTGGGSGGLGDILGGMLNNAGGASAAGGGLGSILGGILGQQGAGQGGGLGDLLNNPAAGAVISGGLANLIKDMQARGHGDIAQSWVGAGKNQPIPPDDLAKSLGSEAIDAMVQHTGMSRDDLLQQLSQHLPQLVDHLTPNGRLPTPAEAGRMV